MDRRLNSVLRSALLGTRFGMVPFGVGLAIALLVVLVEFVRDLVSVIAAMPTMTRSDVMIAVLKLVDLVLVGNLLVMLISAGVVMYMPDATQPGDTPAGWGGIDIASLKLKLFAAVSAIAAIDLLETFVNVEAASQTVILLEIAIMLSFVVSGVLLALMDRLTERRE
jgi:uncharacterized protein (TIGR00645 family)